MELGLAEMQSALVQSGSDVPQPPAKWGDMRQHIFDGALYHWFVLFRNRAFRNFQTNRELSVLTEAALYTRQLVQMPLLALERTIGTAHIRFGGFPYHLVLLQLEHGSSLRDHSPFSRHEDFVDLIVYQRYFDPVTGMACPVEVALERLESGEMPEMSRRTRIASEIQDLMTMLGLRR